MSGGGGDAVVRRVVGRRVEGRIAVEELECGHENTLYRQVRGGRVAWCGRRGHPTNLQARSRECAECGSRGAEELRW